MKQTEHKFDATWRALTPLTWLVGGPELRESSGAQPLGSARHSLTINCLRQSETERDKRTKALPVASGPSRWLRPTVHHSRRQFRPGTDQSKTSKTRRDSTAGAARTTLCAWRSSHPSGWWPWPASPAGLRHTSAPGSKLSVVLKSSAAFSSPKCAATWRYTVTSHIPGQPGRRTATSRCKPGCRRRHHAITRTETGSRQQRCFCLLFCKPLQFSNTYDFGISRKSLYVPWKMLMASIPKESAWT